ncbi:unnamed protein product [Microthlaspi erraticum]|uniref:F-box domain-containing protein n=1 Tax=Microthlaspi erraticum TaxID=1685480 RepID=A0A6D2IH57_9BRAS|nr:unnamed protein product [Microthlaspi erraticum]
MMDFISTLPDEVLCHILSFLTTKHAASTSVLSKRWRDLIAFVPFVEIDDSDLLRPERDGVLEIFMDFVDRVLALQGDSRIKRFILDCKAGIDPDRVNRWIRVVLRRSVSVISLCTDFGDEYQLPPEVFVSKTLVSLKLKGGFVLDWISRGSVSLPMLRNLFLSSVGFRGGQFKMRLPACPVIETIDMEFMDWMVFDVNVSSETLKELFICCDGSYEDPESVCFDTPRLVYLWYSDFVAEDYPKVNLPNLVEARIDLKLDEHLFELARETNVDGGVEYDDEEDDVFLRFRNVWKLFSGMRNVEKLYLAPNTLQVLSLCCKSMPVFNKLKFLHIRSSEDRGWQAMPVLLKNCPNVETLVFEGLLHYVTDKCGNACDCVSREDRGSSLRSCRVKKLEIKGFRGTKRELTMIKHFLLSFPGLEEMWIHAQVKGHTELEVPGTYPLVVEMINLFCEISSCDVHFLVPTHLSKKLSLHNE